MSHEAQINFVKSVRTKFGFEHFAHAYVLEVGSLDINGSVRDLVESCVYTGIDVGPGPGVDLVICGSEYDEPADLYDTVISCECFEHNPKWVQTFKNMITVCRPGGLIIMTCATTGRREHGTARSAPDSSPLTVAKGWGDYYKNLTQEDFEKHFDLSEHFSEYHFSTNAKPADLYFYGIKR